MNKKLVSLEEFKAMQEGQKEINRRKRIEQCLNGIACPLCGCEMYDDNLLPFPVKEISMTCSSDLCRHETTRPPKVSAD